MLKAIHCKHQLVRQAIEVLNYCPSVTALRWLCKESVLILLLIVWLDHFTVHDFDPITKVVSEVGRLGPNGNRKLYKFDRTADTRNVSCDKYRLTMDLQCNTTDLYNISSFRSS